MRKTAMRSLMVVMMLLVSGWMFSAQAAARPDTVVLYFRVGSASYDAGYRGNGREARKLNQMFVSDTTLKIKRLVVVGGASPEGDYLANQRLARVRAQGVIDMLQRRYSWIFVDDRMPIELRTTTSKSMDEWEDAYRIEDLRYAAVYVLYDDRPIEQGTLVEDQIDPMMALPVVAAAPVESAKLASSPDSAAKQTVFGTLSTKKPLFALKTNLLFDLASALNLEIEVPIGRQWSIAAEGVFPWWLWDSKQICLQMLSGHLEARYWFDKSLDRPLFTGWFVGLYGGYGYYDFQFDKKGLQGEFLNLGISAGYGHRIGKNLSLEYSIGIGYAQSDYRTYESALSETNDWYLYRQDTRKADWFGPTRLKVSLVWLLNYNKSERTK